MPTSRKNSCVVRTGRCTRASADLRITGLTDQHWNKCSARKDIWGRNSPYSHKYYSVRTVVMTWLTQKCAHALSNFPKFYPDYEIYPTRWSHFDIIRLNVLMSLEPTHLLMQFFSTQFGSSGAGPKVQLISLILLMLWSYETTFVYTFYTNHMTDIEKVHLKGTPMVSWSIQ